MPRGSVNSWKCPTCGLLTSAVHVHEGVTPMMLRCRRTPGCTGMAVSAGYPPGPQPYYVLEHIDWEWAQASRGQMKRWRREDPAMFNHCQMGGLVLRPISDAGRLALVGAA